MKALIILSLALVSFNIFAEDAIYGENQKSPCPYANQTNKREAKVVETEGSEIKIEAPTTISK